MLFDEASATVGDGDAVRQPKLGYRSPTRDTEAELTLGEGTAVKVVLVYLSNKLIVYLSMPIDV